VDIQLKDLQTVTLLSLVTNLPTIHSRLLANVRAFALCSLFASLTDHGWTGPPSAFQAT
jgi:hypothetical protein